MVQFGPKMAKNKDILVMKRLNKTAIHTINVCAKFGAFRQKYTIFQLCRRTSR